MLPASKSISNRLLILRYIYHTDLIINNLSQAEDTRLMNDLLKKIRENNASGILELHARNAGTVMRFLCAVLAMIPGNYVLSGDSRLNQRPLKQLVLALQDLGAEIEYQDKDGFPPLLIRESNLSGKEVDIDASVSSQFISALMMIAPSLYDGLEIRLSGTIRSNSYIELTAALMNELGFRVEIHKNLVTVHSGFRKIVNEYTVESDWSSAAFWYEIAALSNNTGIVLKGLDEESLQGDSSLSTIFRDLGVQTEFVEAGIRLSNIPLKTEYLEIDFNDFPDLAQAIIVTAASLGIRGRFKGLETLSIKETDRTAALQIELAKTGADFIYDKISSSWSLTPSTTSKINEPQFDTYDDHRMAMALAPLCMKFKSVMIKNPEVVRKSYPDFWKDLEKLGFKTSCF